jgi:recombination protein RecR
MSLNQIPTLQSFVRLIQSIPFVSSRHLYRLSEHFLLMNKIELESFFNEILKLKENLKICEKCCCWKEINQNCIWCSEKRDQKVICVVETWIDVISLERSGIFKGVYHVLGGAIAPIDGITIDVLSFDLLINRLKNEQFFEIIIGTNQTPEGDATACHLERLIELNNIKINVSYLASGIPVGTSLEFVDKLTIGKAFSYRRRNLI